MPTEIDHAQRPISSPEITIAAAAWVGIDLGLDQGLRGFVKVYRPGFDPSDANVKLIEAAIDADRTGVLAVLLARREAK